MLSLGPTLRAPRKAAQRAALSLRHLGSLDHLMATYPWVKSFFEAVRNSDALIANMAKKIIHRKDDTFTWDETQIKDHLTSEDWKSLNDEMVEQVEKQNDRGVAIVCASMVEDRLRWLIETTLIEGLSSNKRNWLFTGVGPMASFVAKREMALALGLISEGVSKELALIARIRNRFAHNFRRVRFSDPEISQLCSQLEALNAPIHEKNEPMKIYGACCFICMMALFVSGQMHLAVRARPPGSLSEKSR